MRSDLSAAILVDQRGLKRREKRPQDDEEGGDAHEGERYARIEETWKLGKANWRQASTNSHQACTKENKNPSFTRNLGRTAGKRGTVWPTSPGSGSRRRCRRRRTSRRARGRALGARCGGVGTGGRGRIRR